MASLRIALAQVSPEEEKEKSARKIEGIIRGARGADLIVFPEYSLGARLEEAEAIAEPLDGEILRGLSRAASESGVLAIIGFLERAEGGPYNSIALLGRDGPLLLHRKAMLFDALGRRESDYVRPGDLPLTLLEIGGFTAGFATCFELRFPEPFREMALAGANLFIVPSAWYAGSLKEEQWVTSASSRAMENVSYLVAVDSAGRAFVGRSVVVNPWGHVELDLGRGERVAIWELDSAAVEEARSQLPLLEIARARRAKAMGVRRIAL